MNAFLYQDVIPELLYKRSTLYPYPTPQDFPAIHKLIITIKQKLSCPRIPSRHNTKKQQEIIDPEAYCQLKTTVKR